jgi:hypothetical protein
VESVFSVIPGFRLNWITIHCCFTVIYFLFEATFTTNDIFLLGDVSSSYPDPKERESIGSLARFTAS